MLARVYGHLAAKIREIDHSDKRRKGLQKLDTLTTQ